MTNGVIPDNLFVAVLGPVWAFANEYAYDPIGNRQTSSDLGTTRAYTANNLNQYTEISSLRASAPPRETFMVLPCFCGMHLNCA